MTVADSRLTGPPNGHTPRGVSHRREPWGLDGPQLWRPVRDSCRARFPDHFTRHHQHGFNLACFGRPCEPEGNDVECDGSAAPFAGGHGRLATAIVLLRSDFHAVAVDEVPTVETLAAGRFASLCPVVTKGWISPKAARRQPKSASRSMARDWVMVGCTPQFVGSVQGFVGSGRGRTTGVCWPLRGPLISSRLAGHGRRRRVTYAAGALVTS
jgi:hypothetical protein